MECEVVVVGGGIGGLTVAALLAARGVNVALFERQARVGGCVANFEFQGYTFEPTSGLYTGWAPGGIHERIFSELPVQPPEVRRLSPAYAVRLPDQTEIAVCKSDNEFEQNLRVAFPECADAAIAFYREFEQTPQPRSGVAAAHLPEDSPRFQAFIDAQLRTFDQCTSDQCSYAAAAIALTAARHGTWGICGGAQALADALAESFKKSGGALRLDSPVLRLAYGADGLPSGIDLLSGERVVTTRAIISNLTIWDTYGRLVGLSRTPKSISTQLRLLEGRGVYMLFLGMDQTAAARLTADRLLLLIDWQHEAKSGAAAELMMFAAAPEWDRRAPEGKRAVTVWTSVDAQDWFTFHQDATAHEEQDQTMLEHLWPRLHAAMPELGDGIEVVESATPLTFHEATRRKLGMVGGLCSTAARTASPLEPNRTIFPNLFLVGDTASDRNGVETISKSAFELADILAPKP